MQKTMPDHAPLLAPNVICHTCGSVLKAQINKGRSGVASVFYECHNKEFGCSYKCESNQYLSGEVVPVRPEK